MADLDMHLDFICVDGDDVIYKLYAPTLEFLRLASLLPNLYRGRSWH